MNLIGNIADNRIKVNFTLEDGPTVVFSDVGSWLWGSRTAQPWIFEARGNAGLVATLRNEGWVLTACANCTGHAVKPPPPSPPAAIPRFDTFESFRRALEEEGLSR